jgi:hypothetical protein
MQEKIDFTFHPFNDYTIDTLKKAGDLSKIINSTKLDNNQVLKPKFNREITVNKETNFYKKGAIQEERYLNLLKTHKILLFRDSFGSSLAPLLLECYEKITLIDTRYVGYELLEQFVDFSDDDTEIDVLFIYSTEVINNSLLLK